MLPTGFSTFHSFRFFNVSSFLFGVFFGISFFAFLFVTFLTVFFSLFFFSFLFVFFPFFTFLSLQVPSCSCHNADVKNNFLFSCLERCSEQLVLLSWSKYNSHWHIFLKPNYSNVSIIRVRSRQLSKNCRGLIYVF